MISYIQALISHSLLIAFIFSNNIEYELNIIDSLSERGIHHESFLRSKRLYKEHSNNIEVMCRMAGSTFIKAQNEQNLKKQKNLFYRGFNYAKEALKSDSLNGYANFWYAAYIGRIGEIEGIKQAILNSYHVKKYGLRAIEFISKPYDPVHHMMGRWHYELADLNEFERIFASLIYEKPPKGSYDKAIFFFSTAIKIKPHEIRNHYWLAKTYKAIGKHLLAKKEFEIVISLNPRDIDDKKMQKDARNLLNKF